MARGRTFLRIVRYYSSVCLLYGGTLLLGLYLFNPSLFSTPVVQSHPALENTPTEPATVEPQRVITMGKPVRLLVPKIALDIRVMEGHYNETDGSWTLRDGRIETYFAMPSALANDLGGNTIIYGHSNKHVFSPLVRLVPGDMVEVHTDNGHVFRYVFADKLEVEPDDASIFTLEGPPQLILQTCTGNWYERRGLHRFTLAETVPASPVPTPGDQT
jgi:LPXTG-site transpeptidase (sortase) family protein